MRIDSSNQITSSYVKMASGKRINSASDDPAGLSTSQKMKSQVDSINVGTKNANTFNDLTKTASSALSSSTNALHRIRELSIQASNSILTDSDKQNIQQEINQLKASINQTSQSTEFNSQKLLNGTFVNKNVASSANGGGQSISIDKIDTESLGISDFDVTGNFNISDIDEAISKISETQSYLGATSNALEHSASRNQVASENLASANSRIEDLDMAAELTKLNTQQILQQYKYYAQKQSAESKNNFSLLL